jgi:NAD(P)-dependent dehydrogenase (short-subunit alcohol dehydrogenase family)/acyl carrier protein
LKFVGDVRSITEDGVDVVLNSLAGEEMERSLACLGSFGRFVELGKRDYIANTHIGLRPFRRNLTYFGVDLDQLMVGKPKVARKLYADVMRFFENGSLKPLPHSVFGARELSQALHLMQHSGHVGKIVVTPPKPNTVKVAPPTFVINPRGTHVITGAFGGFGLETAKWLADHGGRHLLLISRRGASTNEAKAVVGQLAQRGVCVQAEACDIADQCAVEELFMRIRGTMPPVVGVVHAAMVLEDGLISKLDYTRFVRVLTPKVRGAENIDRVTRLLPLDYFVLFSSATTLMGNPGQGNYVAANAYMEGLARRRRQEGLKALAIGWGPITDVGVLARSEILQSRLHKLTGLRGLQAREALDLMGQALAQATTNDLAVMTISPTDGIFSGGRLPVLASPTYANLMIDRQDAGEGLANNIDLQAIARTQGREGIKRQLTEVVVGQLARVLHVREDDVSRVRPLSEIGLDSLMALELAMNLEESFGIQVSFTNSVGSLTVASLVNEVIAQLDLEASEETTMAKTIVAHHIERVESDGVKTLQEIVATAADRKRGLV